MSDSINRITSMLETARDLTLEAAAVASAKLAETPTHVRPQEVSKLLNSRSERDILKGLKYVISLMSSGEDASKFFTDVVKNVTSSSLKIRKLVYTYLLRYSDKENDAALLSVNAIQKSLGDTNEQVRALAIRVMSEIKISSIYPIVLLGIKKCSSDQSPSVRQAAAISLIKVFNNYGESAKEDLTVPMKVLLKDREVCVLNSAILAFKTIFPKDFELIHGHFRRLCSVISDLDEWTQTYLIEILTSYSRLYLPKPKLFNQASNHQEFIFLPERYNEIPFPVYDVEFDPDLKLFLDSIKYLVYTKSEAVILAVGRAYFHLTPPKTFKEVQIAASYVRVLLTSASEPQNFILQSILYMAVHDPTIFVQYEKRFYVLPGDSLRNSRFKIMILSTICNENNIKSIFTELQYYAIHSEDSNLAIEAIKAIGICSQISHFWSSKILKWLLRQISTLNIGTEATSEALNVIGYLVQQNPEANIKTVVRLAQLLDQDTFVEGAKERVIWLVGEFSGIEPKIGPDVVRKLLRGFAYEQPPVRYQTILLAAKVFSYHIEEYKKNSGDNDLQDYNYDDVVAKMFAHAITLGKYDDVYDIRDRSRMFHTLLTSKHTQLATLILQAPKPVPLVSLKRTDPLEKEEDFAATIPVDDLIKKYNILPDWANQDKLQPTSIRDPIDVKEVVKSFSQQSIRNVSGGHGVENRFGNNGYQRPVALPEKKYKLQSLDDFFADEPKRATRAVGKKKIIYEEESSSEEEEDEDEDDEEEESEEEESSEDYDAEEEDDDDKKIAKNDYKDPEDEDDYDDKKQLLIH